MKIMHIGQMIGGLDIYIRNSIIYNKVEGNEYIIACGKDDKHQPVIRNGIEVKEYPISLFRSLNPLNDLKALIEAVEIIKEGEAGCDSLREEVKMMLLSARGNESIFEFDDVMQLDIFMLRFNSNVK